LGIRSIQLFVNIMQKPLNTHGFSLGSLWRGKLLNTKTKLLFAAILLLLLQSTQIASAQAGFVSDIVRVKGRIGTISFSDSYYTNSNSADPSVIKPFDGGFLGTYDRTFDGKTLTGIDSLLINAEANTSASNGDLVSSTQLLYRISRVDGGGEPGSDIPLPLTLTSGDAGGNAKWVSANNRTNLINSATSPGTWKLEVSFQGTATVNKKTQPIVDGRFTALFNVRVNGQDVITQTWSAPSGNNDWFSASNWAPNGIPTQNSDIVIPFISGGTYPSITTGVAQAHNILISGRGTTTGARLTLKGGQLRIFGDFQDANGGFSQSAIGLQGDAGILILAGTTQTFDAAPKLFNLTIQGGGVKTLTRLITLNGNLTFGSGGGILVTRTDNPGQYGINFIGQNNGIRNETANGYVLGVVSTSVDDVQNGQPYDFSNIGVGLTVNNKHLDATSVGTIYATRISNIYSEPGSGSSIRRGYFFSTGNAEPQDFDMTFNYLAPDLNGNQPNNLQIYRSETGDYPFEKLGKDSSTPPVSPTTPGTVSKSGIVGLLSATFTLGEIIPLPVTLVSFTATPAAQGAALLRWTTATETNNKGFGIERQLGKGQPWQSVGYLATGNSANGGIYTYTDKTLASAPDSPLAYYRLRQEDQDGKLNYSPVAVIARSGAVASTALQLSPVPVTGSTISLAFAEAGQAGAEIAIINTQGQRLFTQTTQASSEAAINLPVERLAAGVYIVSVRVPGQAVRHARFVKL
jgi:hypothetical protein